jgi:hypothetical protein
MKTLSATGIGIASQKPEEPPNSLGGDATRMIQALAEPRIGGESTKQALERVARHLRFSYWRAFDIWYGKARRIEDHEYTALTEATHKKNSKDIRNELQDLRLRIARLESTLNSGDSEFHRPTLDALGDQVRGLGGSIGKGVKR